MEPENDSPAFDPKAKVQNVNSGERIIAKTGRHMIGLVFVYFQTFAGLGLGFVLIFMLLPDAFDTLGLDPGMANGLAVFFALLASFLALIFLILATKIYLVNELIVTIDNVTHVAQTGLFHKKVSEISMANVEDVTAHKKGILPTTFNYGRLHIETAGEQNNYDFLYCPNPDAYAKAIQDSRLEFIKIYGD